MRTRPAVLDFIMIAAVCAVALFLFFVPSLAPLGDRVIVSVRNENETFVYKECSLNEPQRFKVINNGITVTVVIGDGEVFVESSDCEDHVCQNSGKISKAGQSIICAPAGIVISVSGGEPDEDISAG